MARLRNPEFHGFDGRGFLPDETEEERDRGITMDVGQNKVSSPNPITT